MNKKRPLTWGTSATKEEDIDTYQPSYMDCITYRHKTQYRLEKLICITILCQIGR